MLDQMGRRGHPQARGREQSEVAIDRALDTELARMAQPNPRASVTAEKMLELASKAVFLYEKQDSVEQRRLLDTVQSNCTFDRGTLSPTYSSPFDLFAKGNETGNWRRECPPSPFPETSCSVQLAV